MLGLSIDAVFAFTKSELAHWIAYLSDNPDGPEFQGRMNAMLCATIETYRWGNTDPTFNVPKFCIHPGNRPHKQEPEHDPEQQADELQAYVALLNTMRGDA